MIAIGVFLSLVNIYFVSAWALPRWLETGMMFAVGLFLLLLTVYGLLVIALDPKAHQADRA